MKDVSVLQALAMTVGGVCFGVVMSSVIAQQKPTAPSIGSPTSMKKAESDFNERLDVILREITKANEELQHHGVQLDRLEENTKQPEPPIVLPSDETSEDVENPRQKGTAENRPIVRLYTADNTWSCAACDVQKKRLAASPPSFEFEIICGPSQGKSPTGKYPAWEIVRPNGATEVRGGVQSTSTLESWVNRQSVRVRGGRYSIAELRHWIRQNYTPTTWLSADVQPLSSVWSHLQDHNHQFTATQVSGLSQWEALALHAAHHSGRITPFRGSAKAVRSKRVRVSNRPHYAAYWRSI